MSPHGRVVLHDTTVRDSTWHGVSGRGASAETPPILRLATDPGECPLRILAYPTYGHPYLFGMVINSEPFHKFVSEAHAVGKNIGLNTSD